MRGGFKFHFLSNHDPNGIASYTKPLIFFLHGFPDSSALWRYVVTLEAIQTEAIVIVPDLPAYGGSDTMKEYSATNLLEALTEFIITIRTKYGVDTEEEINKRRVVIVGHDWGCIIAMRLDAEAPQLADRFILTNGILPGLAWSNVVRRISSSWKMVTTWAHAPTRTWSTLSKVAETLKPLFHQILLSYYVFLFQLPDAMVNYPFYAADFTLLKGVNRLQYGSDYTPQTAAECMASSLGPSAREFKTRTPSGEGYPASVGRNQHTAFGQRKNYYTQGAFASKWEKSLETITGLYRLMHGTQFRRTSSGAGLFEGGPEGYLAANSTIIWGKADHALEPRLCLDGVSDYLVENSQVVILPRAGHFTPIDRESRLVLAKAAIWAATGEKEDIGSVIEKCYPGAAVTISR